MNSSVYLLLRSATSQILKPDKSIVKTGLISGVHLVTLEASFQLPVKLLHIFKKDICLSIKDRK